MRDAVQGVLDVGQMADWITPTYGMIRGGRVFVVSQADISVAEMRALLSGAGVHQYAEQVLPAADGDRLYAFRVADKDVPTVRSLLGDPEPAAATSGGGSGWWVWAGGAVIVFILAFTLGALAVLGMAGGAL